MTIYTPDLTKFFELDELSFDVFSNSNCYFPILTMHRRENSIKQYPECNNHPFDINKYFIGISKLGRSELQLFDSDLNDEKIKQLVERLNSILFSIIV